MANAGLKMMTLEVRAQARAQRVRGGGLAHGADIVAFALDRQQRLPRSLAGVAPRVIDEEHK